MGLKKTKVLFVIIIAGISVSCTDGGFQSTNSVESLSSETLERLETTAERETESLFPAPSDQNPIRPIVITPEDNRPESLSQPENMGSDQSSLPAESTAPQEVNPESSNENVAVNPVTPTVSEESVHPSCEGPLDTHNDPDGDGYGFQNNKTCLSNGATNTEVENSTETETANSTFTNCVGPVSTHNDSDGDGFGFQNNKTCLSNGATSTETETETATETAESTYPNCVGPVSTHNDLDGDGYGFQSGSTCLSVAISTENEEVTTAVSGELLFAGKIGQISPQHNNSSVCVRQDPNRPRAVNYDSLFYSGDFLINSNPWNASIVDYPYEQCMNTGGAPGWTFNWGGQDNFLSYAHVWDVRSYPEFIYGVKRGNDNGGYGEYSHGSSVSETKAKTGLPVEVRNIPEIIIDFDYTSSNSGDYNVSIESFFHSSCTDIVTARDSSNMKYEIMLWLDKGEFNPAGSAGLVGEATIDNIPVEVWTKDENNLHYLTFVVKEELQPMTKGKINWSKFINFAKEEGHRLKTSGKISNRPTNSVGGYNRRVLDDNFCLANILIGTEIWNGRGDFRLNKYEINQYKK